MDELEIPIIFNSISVNFIGPITLANHKRIHETKKMKHLFIILTIVIFLSLAAGFYALRIYNPSYHFMALEIGNLIMALLASITYVIKENQNSARPQAFVRGVYGSSFLKLMVCMICILLYLVLSRPNIHKPTVFMLFGIYVVYSIMETWLLSRTARK